MSIKAISEWTACDRETIRKFAALGVTRKLSLFIDLLSAKT